MCGEERLIWAGRSFWSGDWTLKHGKINREDEEELVCVRGLVVRERETMSCVERESTHHESQVMKRL